MKIAVVEDDAQIGQFLKKGLEEAGYQIVLFDSGEQAYLEIKTSSSFDLLILDLMLPDMPGEVVLRQLRQEGHSLPIIVLSAKRSTEQKISGLELGADDYLVKPFSFSELLARVHAVLRRGNQGHQATNLNMCEISLDLLKRKVFRENIEITLQAKEFKLLEYFMRNPEKVISKTMILENIYEYAFDTQSNVVDVLVCRLRNKIDKDFSKKTIHTLRGLGYVFKCEKD